MTFSMASAEDQRAIESLHTRYVHATDRQDYALLRSLYTADAIEDHAGFKGSIDAFIVWLKEIHPAFVITTHMVTNLMVMVSADGTQAQSEGRGTAYVRMKAEKPFNVIVINRHFDQYRRVDGVWLFSRRSLCVDWAEQFAPVDGPLDLVKGVTVGTIGADDPLYTEVPQLVAALRGGL